MLVYVRYLQIKRDVGWLEGSRAIIAWNRCSLFFGFVSILGASIVGNFPVRVINAIVKLLFRVLTNSHSLVHINI